MNHKARLRAAQHELLRSVAELKKAPESLESTADVITYLEALEEFAHGLFDPELVAIGERRRKAPVMTSAQKRALHDELSEKMAGKGGPNDWSDV